MNIQTKTILVTIAISAAFNSYAFMIDDGRSGSATYWGSDAHGYGDVIAAAGNTTFDINGANVSLANGQLRVDIFTNFAGHAGKYQWAAPNGIGYGDLFLAPLWNPYGNDAHHADDRASNGTVWAYGLNLDNRWNNSGGTFGLYKMSGPSNVGNVLLAENFITSGIFRNGQEVAVNARSANVELIGNGVWTVSPGEISFLFNLAGTQLGEWSGLALHWGPTCQNDVIEGHIPEPASGVLLVVALVGLSFIRRRVSVKTSFHTLITSLAAAPRQYPCGSHALQERAMPAR